MATPSLSSLLSTPSVLVLSDNNLDFSTPANGLASVLTSYNLPWSLNITYSLREVITNNSIFSLIDLLQFSTTASMAASMAAINIVLGRSVEEQKITLQLIRNEDVTNSELDDLISNTNYTNYNLVFEYFNYSLIDIQNIILSPNALLDWVKVNEPVFTSAINHLQARDIPNYIADLLIIKSKLDIKLSSESWDYISSWAAISFNEYAMGEDIDQRNFFRYVSGT